ncbi:histidinol-phosphatase [Candidatus Pseudomonas adelgestsugas]|uniref:histidinol-phosphatase n=1 Tax=Candidatus Pseudomonas adelgestsugas TaxID=1302376 RepID=UPI00100F43CC|nr:HAD family hydrolase [Candidatus Pseudomonas adelgestsugas]
MHLALFDLDNTLLSGDSDHAWGDYLCKRGIINQQAYQARNDKFYQDYLTGTLDDAAYLNFSLEILGRTEMAKLDEWRSDFMRDCINQLMLPMAIKLLAKHSAIGDKLVIITATNRFITAPIAKLLRVETLIATECEIKNGRYTGRSTDISCFREGKVKRLNHWLKKSGYNLEGSYFYSDSINDLPLLKQVTHPVAVDPDHNLRAEAERHNWPIITLRNS